MNHELMDKSGLCHISTILPGELIDHELMDKTRLQTEGRTETGNSYSATRPTLRSRTRTSSTQRPLRLTASSRDPGETIYIINQLKFNAGHSKPLRRTSAASWQTGRSSKEATDFEEAPLTDHSARQRG